MMTVKELIAKLQAIPNQEAKVCITEYIVYSEETSGPEQKDVQGITDLDTWVLIETFEND